MISAQTFHSSMQLVSLGINAGILCCLFLSGMAGLCHEVTWARYLALLLGHSSYAVTIVLAAFMGGLAIGNHFFGRRADTTPSPLRLFGWLEVAVGLYALVFPACYALAHRGFEGLAHGASPGGPGLNALKLLFSLLLILPPTVLMGGSLPILVRVVTPLLHDLRVRVSALYFTNSAGGVVGCLLADFWAIPHWGLPGALFFAGAMNLLAGAMALGLARVPPQGPARATNAPRAAEHEALPASAAEVRLITIAVAVSGFVAMLYEVAWVRLLSLAIGSSVHAFALMLATFIAGISFGSLAISRWGRSRRTVDVFGWIELGAALVLALSLCFYRDSPYWFARLSRLLARDDAAYPLYLFFEAVVCLVIVFPAAACFGATLPLAGGIVAGHAPTAGRSVGRLFALNIIGTVVGAVATGYGLLPALGLAQTFAFGIAVTFLLGVAVLARARLPTWRATLVLAPLFVAACCGLARMTLDDSLRRSLTLGVWREPGSVSSLAEFREIARQNDLLFYRDGAAATVSVNAWTESGARQLTLRVNGKPDASTTGDMGTQLLLGHLPMLLRPDSASVLVVGMGSGMTCGAVACHAALQRLDVVEISPEVAAAAKEFEAFNGRVLADGRLTVAIEDAKTFLQLSDRTYDVLVSEPSNPWMAGVAGVYTREFYQSCRKHLRADGLMTQWIHLYETSDAALDLVLRTFASVFPAMSIWQSRPADLLLIGSAQPPGVDFRRMEAEFLQPQVRESLARVGVTRLPVLLAREVVSEASGRAVPAEGVWHTDLRPVLEYEAQRAFFVHRWADRWQLFDETFSSRAQTLLAGYLKAHPLTAEDFEGLALFYARHQLPSAQVFASLLLRWQKEIPGSGTMLESFARLSEPGPAYELEALRWAPLRESLMKRAETNPFLLRHYADLLLSTYRWQRSVFYLPPSGELESALERLTQTDRARADVYLLRRAALAWDRGDTESCLRWCGQVFAKAGVNATVRALNELQAVDDETFGRLVRAFASAGRLNEAEEIGRALRDAGIPAPVVAGSLRKIAFDRTQAR